MHPSCRLSPSGSPGVWGCPDSKEQLQPTSILFESEVDLSRAKDLAAILKN